MHMTFPELLLSEDLDCTVTLLPTAAAPSHMQMTVWSRDNFNPHNMPIHTSLSATDPASTWRQGPTSTGRSRKAVHAASTEAPHGQHPREEPEASLCSDMGRRASSEPGETEARQRPSGPVPGQHQRALTQVI